MAAKNTQTITLKKSHLGGRDSSRLPQTKKSRANISLRGLSLFLGLGLYITLCFKVNLFQKEAIVCSAIIGLIYLVKSIGESKNQNNY